MEAFLRLAATPLLVSAVATNIDAKPVDVKVFVEALCIDSKNFVVSQLGKAYDLLGDDIMKPTVILWGKANISDRKNHVIECQHGFGECDANSWEQCAIHVYPDPAYHLPFIGCMFESLEMGSTNETVDEAVVIGCSNSSHVDLGPIRACHDDSDEAWELQLASAEATPSGIDYVPWIELNGKRVASAEKRLARNVCKQFIRAGGRDDRCTRVLNGEEKFPAYEATSIV